MKRVFFLLFLIFGCGAVLCYASGNFQLAVPEFGSVGEALPVQISGAEPLAPGPLPAIAGARWQNARRQMVRSVNGETTYTTVFFLVPERPGKLTIPAGAFQAGGQRFPSETVAVEISRTASARTNLPQSAADGEEQIPIGDAIFGRILLPDRADFYEGEEFRMVYQLFVREGIRIHNVEYPAPSGVNDLLFANLSNLPKNRARRASDPRFDTPFTSEKTVKGKRFQVLNFITFCRGVRPGVLHPGGKISMEIVQPDHSGDDLFGGFFSFGSRRLESYTTDFVCASPVTIHPLPAAPPEVPFSGLMGNWAVTAKLSPASAAVGEPVELILSAQGDGSGEPFRVPALNFPGFRAYPPKETRSFGKITVKYVLVPLEAGDAALKFGLSVFNPGSKTYRIQRFDLKLPVRPGVVTPGAALAAPISGETASAGAAPEPEKVKKSSVREELFYLKADRGNFVLTPLVENHSWLFWGMLGFGPFLGICLYGWLTLRKRRAADPAYENRQRCRKMIPKLRKALKNAEDPDQETLRRILDVLAGLLSLPPGAGASEIGAAASARTNDAAMRQAVEALESASFLPGRNALSDSSRKKLDALLKKLCFWAVLLLPFLSGAAENYNQAYEVGKFPEAVEQYRRDVSSGAVSPHALYNLGGTYARMGNLPMARLCYWRAHLLKPADGEITSNLEWVNRKLLQEPLYGSGPAALIREYRDLLRPDQYLLIASGLFFLLCLTAGLLPVLPRKAASRTAGTLLVLLLLAVGCAWMQSRGPYRADEAVVTAEALKLYSLPGAGGRETAAIPGGSSARILDRRSGWVRVSANGQEGWAERSGLEPVFPWGIFSTEPEP